MPFFSVIIPMYNRATLVGRAIDSVLAQDFEDFEVVVVDDGSTDDSAEAVRRYTDARVRLILSDRNRGRCPARNRGMEHARGAWFIFLDSDDELTPGALRVIKARIDAAPASLGSMRFMCVSDRGQLSPDPPHHGEVLDYDGYLRWSESTIRMTHYEALPCVKASTFPAARYGDGHGDEGRYHMDVARLAGVQLLADVVRLYHDDAPQRVMHAKPERMLKYAADSAAEVDETFRLHGDAMRTVVPDLYNLKLLEATTQHFLAGARFRAVRYALRLLGRPRWWPRLFPVLTLGLIGPRAIAWGKTMRMKAQGFA
ncbi:MAG TPA: glycosyltransferase family 2 protein [Thermoanaerobaculia bacterium]